MRGDESLEKEEGLEAPDVGDDDDDDDDEAAVDTNDDGGDEMVIPTEELGAGSALDFDVTAEPFVDRDGAEISTTVDEDEEDEEEEEEEVEAEEEPLRDSGCIKEEEKMCFVRSRR